MPDAITVSVKTTMVLFLKVLWKKVTTEVVRKKSTTEPKIHLPHRKCAKIQFPPGTQWD